MVRGDSIEFENDIPTKHNANYHSFFFPDEEIEIQVILREILDKKIIRESIHESTEFVPPIFMFKMPDGGPRLILNLKELNQFVK